jgi:hypothetical protein
MDVDLGGGSFPLDHQISRVENDRLELGKDESEALHRRLLALAEAPERVNVGRHVDDVREVVEFVPSSFCSVGMRRLAAAG